MKPLNVAAGLILVVSCSTAFAQFVKGNEAVVPANPGKPDLPPWRGTYMKPCAADKACHAGAWHMVETSDGLRECTEPYARPTACRASSYGTNKLARLWVVKSKGVWLLCQYPDLGSKCVNMFARPPANLPYDAVQ